MKETIYITVEQGVVRQVRNVPPGIEVQVIDKDVELEPPERVTISPLDGEACTLATYPG